MKKSATHVQSEKQDVSIRKRNSNGSAAAVGEIGSAELSLILERMQAMRDGDFSVRLPGSWGTTLGGYGNIGGFGITQTFVTYSPPNSDNNKPKSAARQLCEAEAQDQFAATMQSLDSGFGPNMRSAGLKGIAIGGTAGCILTIEAGCVDGAVPGAIVGYLRGVSVSAGQTIVRGLVANEQFKSAMAACAGL